MPKRFMELLKARAPHEWCELDPESLTSLAALELRERLRPNIFSNVRTALVVLSSTAMAFDTEALRQKISMIYPECAVFFRSSSGRPLGVPSPKSVDLLIDFTGPSEVGNLFAWGKQGFFYALKLRAMSRHVVGRNAGIFRKARYNRVIDESKQISGVPRDSLDHERMVQTQVLALAGIPVVPVGELTTDRSRTIALELPPLARS